MAFRGRTQRGYCSAPSEPLRTICADPCGSTCQPPAVHQSTHLHRAPGEDFRALFPVQSAAPLILWHDARSSRLVTRTPLASLTLTWTKVEMSTPKFRRSIEGAPRRVTLAIPSNFML